MAWKSSATRPGPHKNSISEGRGTASLSAGEQVLPRLAQGARQGSSRGSPGQPALQPSLALLTPACSAAKPPRAHSRAHPCQHIPESRGLVAAPAGSFPGCASPLLSWLSQQMSPPEVPPGQAQSVTWPSTIFQLPRLAIFPICSIREAPFIKSSTGAHQHTREKRCTASHPSCFPQAQVWGVSPAHCSLS